MEVLKESQLWAAMQATRENTQWHREESVAVHTLMCLAAYDDMFKPHRQPSEARAVRYALLYHDTGKPESQRVEEVNGVPTNRYPNHAQASMAHFMDRATTDIRFGFTLAEIRAIRWLIEHHLPYELPMTDLARATDLVLEPAGFSRRALCDMLLSDNLGRISDNHAEKIQKAQEWVANFMAIPRHEERVLEDAGTMVLLVGGSTSDRELAKNAEHVIDEESIALKFESVPSFDFRTFFDRTVVTLINEAGAKKQRIVIDMPNHSRSARRRYVKLARSAKLNVHAVEFWSDPSRLTADEATLQKALAAVWPGVEADSTELHLLP